MPIFTTETLLMTIINLSRQTQYYFSLSIDLEVYGIWYGPNYERFADLDHGLAKAYRYFAEVAKEQGLSIVDNEDII